MLIECEGKVLFGRIFVVGVIGFVIVLDVLIDFFVVYSDVFWCSDVDMYLVIFDVKYGDVY